MKRILLSIPNQHWISTYVMEKVIYIMRDGRYKVRLIMPSHKPYENNLHHIVNDFIKGGYDYWLNIDADNPPQNNPLDLVELDKDIIGLPTPVGNYLGNGERPVFLNAFDYYSETDNYREHIKKESLQEVDAVGTGCILIAKRVFNRVDLQKGAFTRKLHEDGTVWKGNDISFCERARANGFRIYAHYDYICDHMSEVSLLKINTAYGKMYKGGN